MNTFGNFIFDHLLQIKGLTPSRSNLQFQVFKDTNTGILHKHLRNIQNGERNRSKTRYWSTMKLLEVHAKPRQGQKRIITMFTKSLGKIKLMKPPRFSRNHDTVHGTFKN